MTAKAKQETTVAAEARTETAPVAPKFTLERLRRDCLKLFGVTTSTFDGAAFGLNGRFTVEEMRGHIDKWQKTRVFPAEKKEAK